MKKMEMLIEVTIREESIWYTYDPLAENAVQVSGSPEMLKGLSYGDLIGGLAENTVTEAIAESARREAEKEEGEGDGTQTDLLAACKVALNWMTVGIDRFDGEPIEPVEKQLRTAIAKAEGE